MRFNDFIRRVSIASMACIATLSLVGTAAAQREACDSDTGVCYNEADTFDLTRRGHHLWSAAASTGVIDESALSRFSAKGSELSFRSGKTGTIIARYPVACHDRVLRHPVIKLRYKDDGRHARVQVDLKTLSFHGGERTIASFDSDKRRSRSHYQSYVTRARRLHCEHATWFEVRLSRNHGGDPRLSLLGLVDGR